MNVMQFVLEHIFSKIIYQIKDLIGLSDIIPLWQFSNYMEVEKGGNLFSMEAFLLNWGTELLFALLAAGVTGFFKWKSSKLKKKLDDYETLVNDQIAQKNEEMMESKLEPIYQELEDLRAYIRETQNIEKAHMALIIASYRFRLVQLCKQFIKQGYITTS